MKEWQSSAAPRILIADDQADVLEALRLLLKSEGYQIDAVTSPQAVIAALGGIAWALSDSAKVGNNRSRWCDKTFDDLITQAKQTSDLKKRTALYKQAQVQFKAQAPWVTVAHSLVYEPIRANVVNFKVDPFGLHIFTDVDLK